jgi:hypothetical protein
VGASRLWIIDTLEWHFSGVLQRENLAAHLFFTHDMHGIISDIQTHFLFPSFHLPGVVLGSTSTIYLLGLLMLYLQDGWEKAPMPMVFEQS